MDPGALDVVRQPGVEAEKWAEAGVNVSGECGLRQRFPCRRGLLYAADGGAWNDQKKSQGRLGSFSRDELSQAVLAAAGAPRP